DITERHRAQQDLAKRANELMTLYETSLTVNAQTDLPELLHTIIRRAAELTGGDVGSLHLMDADRETLRLVVGWQLEGSAIGVTQRLGEGIAGRVAQSGEEVVNNDYEHWMGKAEPYARMDVQCMLGVPLKTRQNVIGVIVIANHHREEPFTEEQIRLVRLFADQAAIAVEHARLYKDVQQLAITDELTGIYNRRGLYQFGEREVERARRFHRPLSAIMFDIDHFKWVNDRHSHAAGDQVLRALAECSQKNARHLDILGRYGGEEFVLLLPETDIPTASQVAERLRSSIQNTTVVFEGHEICVTASLGIAELTLAMADLSALIAAADNALLAAKDAGRNRVSSTPA
ncbi:MAG TPA: sensor domain-containing diguanylate cyclase, partial [Anaerolineae bacterium]